MSGRTRLILTLVIAVLVWVAFFFFFIRPRQSDLSKVKDDIVAEQGRTQTLQAELARLQDLQAHAPELEAELSKIRQLVPQTHEIPNFIFEVQDAANASGVDFVSITPDLPKAPPEGAAVAEVRMTLGAGGGYFAIQDFIRRLYDLDRAVRLDTLSLSASEDAATGVVVITMDTSARMFFEVPAAPATGDTGTTTTPPATPAPSPTA